ncbi:MAG: hypothetical protein ACOCV2_10345, partial [Persicimonas sp.]
MENSRSHNPLALLGRLLVSAAVVAVVVVLAHLPVPGAPDLSAVGMEGVVSLGAFNIRPFIYAFLLVEFAALVVPRWRELRTSGLEGRWKLRRASIALAFVFTFIQGWSITLTLERYGHLDFQRALMIVSWLGACGLIAVLINLIDRYGLGQSFSILVIVSVALEIDVNYLEIGSKELAGPNFEPYLATLGVVVVVAAWSLSAVALASS